MLGGTIEMVDKPSGKVLLPKGTVRRGGQVFGTKSKAAAVDRSERLRAKMYALIEQHPETAEELLERVKASRVDVDEQKAKRVARKKQQAVQGVMDSALEAVREGRYPQIEADNHDIMPREVADPNDQRKRTVAVAILRDDPVGRMYRRGHLGDLKKDRRLADVRLEAARDWQSLYERAEIGGAKAFDYERDKVDGGRMAEPDSASRLRAQEKLTKIANMLGRDDTALIELVLGRKLGISVVAQMWGRMERSQWLALGGRFRDALDTIAETLGRVPPRNLYAGLRAWGDTASEVDGEPFNGKSALGSRRKV